MNELFSPTGLALQVLHWGGGGGGGEGERSEELLDIWNGLADLKQFSWTPNNQTKFFKDFHTRMTY